MNVKLFWNVRTRTLVDFPSGRAFKIPAFYRRDKIQFQMQFVDTNLTGGLINPLVIVPTAPIDFNLAIGTAGTKLTNDAWTHDDADSIINGYMDLNTTDMEAKFSGIALGAPVPGLYLEARITQDGAPFVIQLSCLVFNTILQVGQPDPTVVADPSALATAMDAILLSSTDLQKTKSGDTITFNLTDAARPSCYTAVSQAAMLALTTDVQGVTRSPKKGDLCLRSDLNEVLVLSIADSTIVGHWTAIAGTPAGSVNPPGTLSVGQSPTIGTSPRYMREDALPGLPGLATYIADGFMSKAEFAELQALFPAFDPTVLFGAALRAELPISSGVSCPSTATDVRSVGQAGALTVLQIHVRGVIEPKVYTGGTSEGYFRRGGTPQSDNSNVYSLTVVDDNGTTVYYLNSHPETIPIVSTAIDYEALISIRGAATLTLKLDSIDGEEIPNDSGIVIPGIPPAPAAFNGQFIQIDCDACWQDQNPVPVIMTEQVISLSAAATVNIAPPAGFRVHTTKITLNDAPYDAAYTAKFPILHANAQTGDLALVHIATPTSTDVTVQIFDNTTGGTELFSFDCQKTGYGVYALFEYSGTWSLIDYRILTETTLSNVYLRGTVAYASSLAIDFDGPAYQEVSVTGAITISTTNRAAAGFTKSVAVKLIASGADRAFALNGSIAALGTIPSSLIEGKVNWLSLTSCGPNETDTTAVIASQA